ncbi:MAG: hypothetical protein H6740_10740 [Alphaproteobacteria bacterium]|nr:hypothetical protein [Alphaproteobacteria bacterium]
MNTLSLPSAPAARPFPALNPHAPSRLQHRLLYRGVDWYLKDRDGLELVEAKLGPELSEAERAELEAFRGQVAAQAGMAYLLSPEQQAIEARLRLDEVSWHLRMRHEGALVGALRLIPYPFETAALVPELAPLLEQYQGFLELGRLMSTLPGRGVSRRMILASGLHIVRRTRAEGYIALLKPKNVDNFARFGMEVVREGIRVPMRPGSEYVLMASTMENCVSNVNRHVFFARAKMWAAQALGI